MKRLVLVAAVAAFSSSALAGNLYDNGAPNYASGNEMSGWVQAEDFTGVTGTVGGATFTYINLANDGNASWDGTLDWFIYTDSGAQPGTLIASGAGSNFGVSFDGNFNGWDNYTMAFDFGTGVAVDAGTTYWLGLNLNTGFTNDSLFWTTTDANGTTFGNESNGSPDGPWNNNGQEHSFSLQAVPAPGAFALLGLAGLVARRRRRS